VPSKPGGLFVSSMRGNAREVPLKGLLWQSSFKGLHKVKRLHFSLRLRNERFAGASARAMPQYFIIAIATGLALLIMLMLGLLLFFHTPTSPASSIVALGTFAAPAGLSVPNRRRIPCPSKRAKPAP
jgi:hypothetical protein